MSEFSSMLFIWTKGGQIRRTILEIIKNAQDSKKPIFATEITKIYNELKHKDNQRKSVSITTIRKHVKILLKYGYIAPINKGGKPTFLKMTEEGSKTLKMLFNT